MDSGLIFMHRVQDDLEFKAKNNEFTALETQNACGQVVWAWH